MHLVPRTRIANDSDKFLPVETRKSRNFVLTGVQYKLVGFTDHEIWYWVPVPKSVK
jgi:hypothetical protein